MAIIEYLFSGEGDEWLQIKVEKEVVKAFWKNLGQKKPRQNRGFGIKSS
ncbi:hypothetical protein [Desulfonatronospira thiodismutans]|nr:hypothetical protein [Desulfonatronospira thiodismutans]